MGVPWAHDLTDTPDKKKTKIISEQAAVGIIKNDRKRDKTQASLITAAKCHNPFRDIKIENIEKTLKLKLEAPPMPPRTLEYEVPNTEALTAQTKDIITLKKSHEKNVSLLP